MQNDPSLRPFQTAERFLETYLEQHSPANGDRLPSTRNIAMQIGISEGTVRNVVRKWEREGKLESRQGSGVYFRRPGQQPVKKYPFHVGANIRDVSEETSEHSSWREGIISAMTRRFIQLGPKVSFTSLYSADENIDTLSSGEIERRCRQFKGLIINLSDPHLPVMIAHCQKHGKPYVTLNPPAPGISVNFVMAQTYTAYDLLARALVAAGRRRFALFVYPEVNHSESMAQRLSGLVKGMAQELGRSVELRVIDFKKMDPSNGHEAMRRLVDDEGYQPDAVILSADAQATGVVKFLGERGLSIPGEVAVVSGAGFAPQVQELRLTSFVYPIDEAGRQLADLLMQMLEKEVALLPGVFLPVTLKLDQSTTDAENALLREYFARPSSL